MQHCCTLTGYATLLYINWLCNTVVHEVAMQHFVHEVAMQHFVHEVAMRHFVHEVAMQNFCT